VCPFHPLKTFNRGTRGCFFQGLYLLDVRTFQSSQHLVFLTQLFKGRLNFCATFVYVMASVYTLRVNTLGTLHPFYLQQ
jgi:hypothetical protein